MITRITRIILFFLICVPVVFGIFAELAVAQGNIYGSVSNSDMTVPANGQIAFVGFLDGTDEEIRIESCIGAGYDNGNWYDDFQNYLTEAAGNPYEYRYFNADNHEGAILTGLIPNNSFEQENIQLSLSDWPDPPDTVYGVFLPDTTIELSWPGQSGLTCRIYRRSASSGGSLFRIDDPSGSTTNPGTADSVFIDTDIDYDGSYAYLIIPLNNGIMGRPAGLITVRKICGDIDSNGRLNLLDAVYLINYLYKGGPEPVNPDVVDMDGRARINILDSVYLINYLYRGGPEPACD
nr:hypothetical protein [candidate division Zixibacteria bacterium]